MHMAWLEICGTTSRPDFLSVFFYYAFSGLQKLKMPNLTVTATLKISLPK